MIDFAIHYYNYVLAYFASLGHYLFNTWSNLTPMQYGIMLILIAFVGWLMMKSRSSRC